MDGVQKTFLETKDIYKELERFGARPTPYVFHLLMFSPNRTVVAQAELLDGEDALVRLWMVTPDDFLCQVDITTMEDPGWWVRADAPHILAFLRSIGLDPDDRDLWSWNVHVGLTVDEHHDLAEDLASILKGK